MSQDQKERAGASTPPAFLDRVESSRRIAEHVDRMIDRMADHPAAMYGPDGATTHPDRVALLAEQLHGGAERVAAAAVFRLLDAEHARRAGASAGSGESLDEAVDAAVVAARREVIAFVANRHPDPVADVATAVHDRSVHAALVAALRARFDPPGGPVSSAGSFPSLSAPQTQ